MKKQSLVWSLLLASIPAVALARPPNFMDLDVVTVERDGSDGGITVACRGPGCLDSGLLAREIAAQVIENENSRDIEAVMVLNYEDMTIRPYEVHPLWNAWYPMPGIEPGDLCRLVCIGNLKPR